MTHIAPHPETYAGRVVGNGHCVAYVREAAKLGHTSTWRAGDAPTRDTPAGTAIATFDDDGRYGNHTDGRSHAAILIAWEPEGLRVWDQWLGQPVHSRLIRFPVIGKPTAANDGHAYRLIDATA